MEQPTTPRPSVVEKEEAEHRKRERPLSVQAQAEQERLVELLSDARG